MNNPPTKTTARRSADPACHKCKGIGYIHHYNPITQSLAYWCKCTEPVVEQAEPFDWLKAIREASS